ncbi:hypothetical protein ACH42_00140 [Endozoicomonas sp. (ex Bugula neritina AB1)]|nr:hypothetical protein ACH42_00140 [Endozoicomonas sp. (ex Bugula neritina AB1)]
MRGVFTAGVLDAFLDKRLKDFDHYYGVSAGALNLSSYIAGQRGRSQSLYTNLCIDPRFISISRHLKGGNLFDLDWFFEKLNMQYSLDERRFKEQLTERTFTIVTTNTDTGTPCYQAINSETTKKALTQTLKATSALPMIYRDPIMVNDTPMMDGSLSDPMPVLKAIEDGCTDIILVRTRPINARKKSSPSNRMLAWQYRRQPAIAALIRQQYALYNESANQFESLELSDNITLTQVAPEQPLSSTRSTRNRARLVADYHLGYSQGFALARKLKSIA